MKEIVKVLLQEGIDEETIHEVLNIIEENYEIVDEGITDKIADSIYRSKNPLVDKLTDAVTKSDNPLVDKIRKTKIVRDSLGRRALHKARGEYDRSQAEHNDAVKQAKGLKTGGIAGLLRKETTGHMGETPTEVMDRVEDKGRARRQARKNYHNTIDKYGVKFKGDYQKTHDDYQRTHDENGRRKK